MNRSLDGKNIVRETVCNLKKISEELSKCHCECFNKHSILVEFDRVSREMINLHEALHSYAVQKLKRELEAQGK